MDSSTIATLKTQLCSILPPELVDGMMSNLESAVNAYQTRQYDVSVLSSGKFVEFALRALEFLFGKVYTPLSNRLPNFTNQSLDDFATKFNTEPCKTLIPRTLFSMYCIRSKRGGIHVAINKPNCLDAAKLIYDMKWIIYELISTVPGSSDEVVATALENFSSPLSQIIWDIDDTKRVLSERISCSEQVLLLLYSCGDMRIDQLRSAIEYKNVSRFKNTILTLHKRRLINCGNNNYCTISPLGAREVEEIINKIRSSREIKN